MTCIMKLQIKYVSNKGDLIQIEDPRPFEFWAQSLEIIYEDKSWCLHLPGTYCLKQLFVGNTCIGYKLCYRLDNKKVSYLRKVTNKSTNIITEGNEKAFDFHLWKDAKEFQIILLRNKVHRYQVI